MKTVIASTLLAGMVAITPSPSHAVLKISIDVDGSTFTCVDNDVACDTSSAIDTIITQDQIAIGDLRFAQMLINSQFAIPFDPVNLLSASIPVINGLDITGKPRNYDIAISQTGFIGQVEEVTFSSEGTLSPDTFGRSDVKPSVTSMIVKSYADSQNQQGADNATDAPGTNLSTVSISVGGDQSFPFSFSSTGPFSDKDFFSMSMHSSGVVADGGLIQGAAMSMLARETGPIIPPVSVPEPSSIFPILSAVGMIGLLGWRRKL